MVNIAVILTCHNRKIKTLGCLKLLEDNALLFNGTLKIYLVDDGSIDGTGEAVLLKYPNVRVIQGDGNLYWNQGMRLAWKTASKQNNYDFYLWLNDDTILDKEALSLLLEDYNSAIQKTGKPVIITAACRKSLNDNVFSYGGRLNDMPIIPNGVVQECNFINGNCVLVPKEIYEDIGILSNDYTHGLGDNDYGLRAQEAGYSCYTTSRYLAVCLPNEGIPKWCDPSINLTTRWKYFHSPTGLNIREYNSFRRRFWGIKWPVFALKAYAKMLAPSLYFKLQK